MSVRRFLDVSAGHLSIETWTWLEGQTTDDVVRDPSTNPAEVLAGRTRHGWFVYANECPAPPIPDDMASMMRYARHRGCEYILLDCDALLLENLPVLHPDFGDADPPG